MVLERVQCMLIHLEVHRAFRAPVSSLLAVSVIVRRAGDPADSPLSYRRVLVNLHGNVSIGIHASVNE